MKIFSSRKSVLQTISTLKEMVKQTGAIDPRYAQVVNEKLNYSYKDAVAIFFEEMVKAGLFPAWQKALEVEK